MEKDRKQMSAQEAYADLIEELFRYDDNPTYELCGMTLYNRYGAKVTFAMEDAGLIRYIGRNHNNVDVFQVRGI